jgi:hypothetical protein
MADVRVDKSESGTRRRRDALREEMEPNIKGQRWALVLQKGAESVGEGDDWQTSRVQQ